MGIAGDRKSKACDIGVRKIITVVDDEVMGEGWVGMFLLYHMLNLKLP